MSLLTPNNPFSLLEVTKRLDPNGQPAIIAEILHKVRPLMGDFVWMQANGATFHKMVRRATLYTGAWRKYNSGVPYEASQTTEVSETMGMLETYLRVDAAIAELNGEAAYRQQESIAALEGLGQTLETAIISGNAGANPEQFNGLQVRLASLRTTDPTLNVWGAGGTGSDLTSIYGIRHAANQCFMIYPKGAPGAGIQHKDLKEQMVTDGNSYPYTVLVDHYKLTCGMAVADPRALLRICNIETTLSANIFDEDLLIKALNEMPSTDGLVLYCNSTILSQAQIALKDKNNVSWTADQGLSGVPFMRFQGVPVKKCEMILNTESAVS